MSLNDFAGNPSPAIATSPGRSTSEASLMIETITHFGGESLTFSADMILVAEGGGTGGGSFVVRDFPGGSAIAGVTLDAQSSMLTFTIGTDVSSSMGIVPGWHTYSFTFNASGIASWEVSGHALFSVTGFHPPAAMVVSLENNSGSAFDFDNVLVTSP